MKKNFFYIGMMIACLMVGCDVAYEYDIESGIDENTSDGTSGDSQSMSEIDVSMWEYATIFPGLVDTAKEVKVKDYMLELDVKPYVAANVLGIKQVPAPYASTGFYAGAGEPVTIEVIGEHGVSVLIGPHMRDMTNFINTNGGFVERYPLVTMTQALFPGTNVVKNPFGGAVWIRKDGAAANGKLQLKITGAYKSPDYVKGETDATQWFEEINSTTVPWVELRGEHIAFYVPTSLLKVQITSPQFVVGLEESLGLWDDLMECFYRFYGLDNTDDAFPMPAYPERVVMDVHLENERFSYVNPRAVELLQSSDMIDMVTNPDRIKTGDIAVLLGWLQNNNYLPSHYGTSQSSNLWSSTSGDAFLCMPYVWFLEKHGWMRDVVSSYRISTINSYQPKDSKQLTVRNTWNLKNVVNDAMSYAKADTCKLYTLNLDLENMSGTSEQNCGMTFFFSQIGNYVSSDGKNGWDFWGYFNRNVQNVGGLFFDMGMDYLAVQLGEYFQKDFSAMFNYWGIELSDNASRLISGYAPMEWRQWEYNPIEKNMVLPYDGSSPYTASGKVPYRNDRSKWVAFAYSGDDMETDNYFVSEAKGSNPEAYKPASLFDGRLTTFWASKSDEYNKYKDEGDVEHFPYKDEELYKNATTPEFPYYIVIKPGNETGRADGFYIGNGNSEDTFLYEGKDKKFSYAPQHIIIEITNDHLELEPDGIDFVDVKNIRWTKVYDSDETPAYFHPDRKNLFYVEFPSSITYTGIRLTFDRVSHVAKDKPADWDEEAMPNRPETNHQLDRIQKIAEFGTYYYK